MARLRYSLATLARSSGRRFPRGRPVTLRVFDPPAALRRELFLIYMRAIRAWQEVAAFTVLPAYENALLTRDGALTRDDAGEVESALASADDQMQRLLLTLTPTMRAWVVRLEKWHRSRFVAAALTATGVKLDTLLSRAGVEETVEAVFQRNLNLIRNVSDDTRKAIGDAVWDGYTNRTPRTKVAKQIVDAGLGIARKRALLIAADQTVKLAARLDQERQLEAGIEEYVWRHSRKAHPRVNHQAREGMVFRWAKPPPDGHPGTLIHCGCKGQAHIDGL